MTVACSIHGSCVIIAPAWARSSAKMFLPTSTPPARATWRAVRRWAPSTSDGAHGEARAREHVAARALGDRRPTRRATTTTPVTSCDARAEAARRRGERRLSAAPRRAPAHVVDVGPGSGELVALRDRRSRRRLRRGSSSAPGADVLGGRAHGVLLRRRAGTGVCAVLLASSRALSARTAWLMSPAPSAMTTSPGPDDRARAPRAASFLSARRSRRGGRARGSPGRSLSARRRPGWAPRRRGRCR